MINDSTHCISIMLLHYLKNNTTAKPFVCVYIYGLVSYSHGVLKPQLQSTPMNLQCKIIEGKEVLEQFSNSCSRTY